MAHPLYPFEDREDELPTWDNQFEEPPHEVVREILEWRRRLGEPDCLPQTEENNQKKGDGEMELIKSTSHHSGEAMAFAIALPSNRTAIFVRFEYEELFAPDGVWGGVYRYVAGVKPAADWEPRLTAKWGGDLENDEELLPLRPEEEQFLRAQGLPCSYDEGKKAEEKIFGHD